jgi:hypothetical protein
VACGTGRGIDVVDPHHPGFPIHVELILESPVEDPVFRLFVYLDLRVIWAEMALAAILRFSRLLPGKTMTGVTGATGSWNPVRVDSTDPRVGPSRRIELSAFENLDLRSMALPTPNSHSRGSTDNLPEIVVQGIEDLTAFGMVALCHLLDLIGMATATVLGGHEEGNRIPIVIHGVDVPLLCAMAVIAIHARLTHSSQSPLLNERRRQILVAFDAGLSLRGTPGRRRVNLRGGLVQC